MVEEIKKEDTEEKSEKKKMDPGMKWVIFADVLGALVIGLLIWANIVERQGMAEAAKKAAQEQQAVSTQQPAPAATPEAQKKTLNENYDYDLKLTPENCDGVSGTVDLVLITDTNYMDFTRVAINSAKETKCPLSHYNFNVMTVDVSQSDMNALKALGNDTVKVRILPQQEADLFYVRDTHVSKASLLKYYIPNAVPELDKVLYIDSDVLVLHDLNKLFQTDIDNVYLAAVKDPSWFFENTHVVELNLDKRGFYFNSGVMLMNLKKFREDNLIEKLETFTNNNFRTYMDQDALNVVVGDKVSLLPFEDNAINFFFEHVDMADMNNFYDRNWKTYDDVFAPVTILHFASSKKPLGEMAPKNKFFHMLQRLWYKYYTPLPPLD